jgi:hypothetical protein
MKKTLLIALLLIPLLGISQTKKPIDGFLGIKFGSSRPAVIAALNAKGGVLYKKETTADMLVYKNIKLGHRDAGLFVVRFIDGKSFEADFVFDPGEDAHTLEYYYSLVNDINENYGAGDSKKTFKDPYNDEDEDNIKINAITHGNAKYVTYWKSNNNFIKAVIGESLAVTLVYQDGGLANQAEGRQKEKEKSDY